MLRTTIVLAALALAPTPSREDLRFAPLHGQRVQKTFEARTELVLEGASLVMGGEYEDVPIEISAVSTRELAVTDEYTEVAAGRPARLLRRYDEVRGTARAGSATDIGGGGEIAVDQATPLQGRSVRFDLDAAGSRYLRRFADTDQEPDEAARALLDGLEEDLDLRAWLPKGAVAMGESWDVAPVHFMRALEPGGELALAPTDAERAARLQSFALEGGLAGLLGAPEGALRAKLVSIGGVGSERVARIEVAGELSFRRTIDGAHWPAFVDPAPPGASEVKAELRRTEVDGLLDARGVLEWEVAAGRFRTFTLEGTLDLKTAQDLDLSLGRQSIAVRMELDWTAVLALDAALRPL